MSKRKSSPISDNTNKRVKPAVEEDVEDENVSNGDQEDPLPNRQVTSLSCCKIYLLGFVPTGTCLFFVLLPISLCVLTDSLLECKSKIRNLQSILLYHITCIEGNDMPISPVFIVAMC